jgi:SnoaL-like protein
MLRLLIALALAVVVARPVVASEEGDVMAPVRQFIDGFNKSDINMAQAACADQTFIIDDFPPHEWRGSGATSKWFRDLTRMGKKNGMSEAFVTLLKPRQVNVTGTHAYVIVPVNLRYNDKGQLVKRTGLMTLALHKGVGGWRIAAWAWTWG